MSHFHCWKQAALVLGIVLTNPGLSSAATYFVNEAGDDSNPGTEIQPWKTVQKAFTTLVAGDTANVAAGNYQSERLTTAHSGTAEKPITFVGTGLPLLGSVSCAQAYVTLDGFSLRSHPGAEACVYFELTADHCIVENCTFEQNLNDKAQVGMRSGDWGKRPTAISLLNNRFLGNTYYGVALQGKGHVFRGNYFGTPSKSNTTHDGTALYLHSCDTLISGNTWENYHRPNLQAHCDLIQAFATNGETARDNIIEKNLFKNGIGTQVGNLEDQGDHGRIARWTWRNNIWMNIEGGCSISCDEQYFYNNVFYRCGTGSVLLFTQGDRGNSSGCKVVNNIFYECGITNKDSLVVGWWGFSPSKNYGSGFAASHNLIAGWAGSAAYKKDSTWTQAGQNASSFNGIDPLFVDAAGGDFHLRKSSPCLGAGLPLTASFADDFSGAPRGAVWDIGAWQNASTVSAAIKNQ